MEEMHDDIPNTADNLVVNPDKDEVRTVDGVAYSRFGVRTHVLDIEDDICEVAKRYVGPHIQPGDTVFLSEKALGCTQGRAVKLTDIHPRPLARLLSRFVTKTPAGIGLGMPETMEMAFQEVGTPRILLATVASAVGKLFGRRGWFYLVAGRKAASIDGPCSYTLPPYNQYVSLAPAEPSKACEDIARALGGEVSVAVIDLNDLGGEVLGSYGLPFSPETLIEILRDNPLGQESQCTPFGIVRAHRG